MDTPRIQSKKSCTHQDSVKKILPAAQFVSNVLPAAQFFHQTILRQFVLDSQF